MSDEIDNLISTLNQLFKSNNPLYHVIKKPALLIEGLNELKNMIDMKDIKLMIVEQIKLLMTNKARNNTDHHMLHSVISGNPGVGKTTVARILAKIWISLDMIKKPTKIIDNTYTENLEKEIMKYDYQLNQLNKGLEKQIVLMGKIKIGVNNLKHNGRKDYTKLLSNIRDAKNNLDKLLNKPDIIEEEVLKFTIATRADFIGGFQGQTSLKTKAILENARGGVLLIDEAYSLYTSERDSYGIECLTVINEFMSLYPDELIIIFAGYKNMLLESIFKAQPGLSRRVQWFFDIPKYNQDALANIFKKQLEQNGWLLDPNITIDLKKYKNISNPGDTEKLVFQCKIAYAEHHFNNTLDHHEHNSLITNHMILTAIDKIKKNTPDIKTDVPIHMYL